MAQSPQDMFDNDGTVGPEEGRRAAQRRLSETFREEELVWLLGETYDPVIPGWRIEVLRQGANARWVRQRFRYDQAADVLYYLGEIALSDAEFRDIRAAGTPFPVVV